MIHRPVFATTSAALRFLFSAPTTCMVTKPKLKPIAIPTTSAITSPSRGSRPAEKVCRHSTKMPRPRSMDPTCQARHRGLRSKDQRKASHAYPSTCSSFIEGDARLNQLVTSAYPTTVRFSHSMTLVGISAPSIKSNMLRIRTKVPMYLATTNLIPCLGFAPTDHTRSGATTSIADDSASTMLDAHGQGRRIRLHGDITAGSYCSGKHIGTLVEGGIIFEDDYARVNHIRVVRDHLPHHKHVADDHPRLGEPNKLHIAISMPNEVLSTPVSHHRSINMTPRVIDAVSSALQ